MARIEHLSIHQRSIALKRPFVTAIRTAHAVDALLVEIRDSDGRCGWGEAPISWRVTGESIESVTAAILGPLYASIEGLSSSDPEEGSRQLDRAVVRNSSARMALDCALYDLAARAADLPLYRYLGATSNEIVTDMTLSAVVAGSDTAQLALTAADHARQGFRTLKIKVGAGADDLATLVEARKAVGAHVRLRVDANQAWTPEQAVRFIGSAEDAGVDVEFVEQPVHRDDIEGLAFVTAHVQTPIMADESVWTLRDLREIVRMHAASMVNIKLAKTGGLRGAIALLNTAREHDVGVIAGCMAESHVGIAAAGALASLIDCTARRGAVAHDLDGGLLLSESPVRGGVVYDGERVCLTDSTGTGIVGLTKTAL